ncbi:unnamed protein product, partial [Rangifer tarandus platyrhynchus]
LPCPSPTSGCSANSCPLSQGCHPAISSCVVPFSSRLQLPCPSPTSGCSANSCPLSQGCHPAISSCVVPFSSRL